MQKCCREVLCRSVGEKCCREVLVRLCFCGYVAVVVILWLRFCGGVCVVESFCGGVVVFVWLCFCVFCGCLWWCVVFLRFCDCVVVFLWFLVVFLRFGGGVVVFLWWCLCGFVSVVFFLWGCFCGEKRWRRELWTSVGEECWRRML